MGQQEIRNALVGVDLIFNAREAVAFVFIDFVIDGAAAFLDGIDHLLGFRLGAARVVTAGEQEQRRLDLIDEVNRGAIFVQSFVLTTSPMVARSDCCSTGSSFSISVNQLTKGTMGTPAAQRSGAFVTAIMLR